MEHKMQLSSAAIRRKKTRTKIQLGGLIEKAELLDSFGINPGDDLQQDETLQDNVATLFGALLEIKSMIQNDDYSATLWKLKGKKGLK
jgi:hypothetical protein